MFKSILTAALVSLTLATPAMAQDTGSAGNCCQVPRGRTDVMPTFARDYTLLDAQSGTNKAFVFVNWRAREACKGDEKCLTAHRELSARIARIATDMEELEKRFPEQ